MSSTSQELRFFDFLDNQIAFSGVTPSPDRPWAAIIHHPPRMPPFWDPSCLPSVYMKTPAFVESLSSCRFLVTLSQHLADSIRDLIQNDHIPIHVILHPTRIPRTVFSMESLHANQNPKLISIGWSFRRLTSIYQIGQVTSYQRAWLIGKQIHRVMSLLRDESQHERVEIVFGSVQIIHDLPITEYDSLLSENIAFIDVYDASANNAVVECIVRRTPLVARRHPALEEYLGSEYPLFYDHLDEVTDEFLSMTRIQSAYDHLSSIPADRFSILHFYEKIFYSAKKIDLESAWPGQGTSLVPAQHTPRMSQEQLDPILIGKYDAPPRREIVLSFIEEDIDDSTSTTEVIDTLTETTKPERTQQRLQESRSRSQIHNTVQWQSST
jgi:hypothetical protein